VWHDIVRDVRDQLLEGNIPWVTTLWRLLIDPGNVAREFVEGRRAIYVHPLKFAFYGVLIATLLGWGFLDGLPLDHPEVVELENAGDADLAGASTGLGQRSLSGSRRRTTRLVDQDRFADVKAVVVDHEAWLAVARRDLAGDADRGNRDRCGLDDLADRNLSSGEAPRPRPFCPAAHRQRSLELALLRPSRARLVARRHYPSRRSGHPSDRLVLADRANGRTPSDPLSPLDSLRDLSELGNLAVELTGESVD